MKTCKKCVKSLPETMYYRSGHIKKNGTQALTAICKICFQNNARKRLRDPQKRAAYLKYQKQYQSTKGLQKRLDRFKWIDGVKSAPCMDCYRRFPPECMDFDHRDPKKKIFNVSQAAVSGNSLESIKAEIAKCDLVCSNCHRIRTAKQQGRRN